MKNTLLKYLGIYLLVTFLLCPGIMARNISGQMSISINNNPFNGSNKYYSQIFSTPEKPKLDLSEKANNNNVTLQGEVSQTDVLKNNKDDEKWKTRATILSKPGVNGYINKIKPKNNFNLYSNKTGSIKNNSSGNPDNQSKKEIVCSAKKDTFQGKLNFSGSLDLNYSNKKTASRTISSFKPQKKVTYNASKLRERFKVRTECRVVCK